jgi:phosphoglycerol geranylgeranyltransferase
VEDGFIPTAQSEPFTTIDRLLETKRQHGAGFWVLIDPDRHEPAEAALRAEAAEEAGADAILVGSSLLISDHFCPSVEAIKAAVSVPVVIFPGNTQQISAHADAILFLSLISSRNAELLIGQHVKAAPTLRKLELEPIPTGYLLIESGSLTSIEYMSNSKPIPRAKPDIAMAHVLAAQYLGMKLVYLDAGSGGIQPVPFEMIEACAGYVDIPLIVGGGIHTGEHAEQAVRAGASFIVVGNALEKTHGSTLLAELATAVHEASRGDVRSDG